MKMVLERWLENLNKEFRSNRIEARKRPWKAIERYSTEFNVSVDLSSGIAKSIFNWFEAHSKPGTHLVGSLYKSVYFYDSQFWPVSIPIIYGSVELNALKSLDNMPEQLKDEMMKDQRQAWDYMAFWADCVDYGLGVDDLEKTSDPNSFGMRLFRSGDQELRATISILNQSHPDSRAILSSRMALEIFFKAFVALKCGMTEKQAKRIGHNLNKGLSKFIEASGDNHFEVLRDRLSVFPEIHERYERQEILGEQLWEGFAIAHSIGAIIIREHTDRNVLEQIIPSKK